MILKQHQYYFSGEKLDIEISGGYQQSPERLIFILYSRSHVCCI